MTSPAELYANESVSWGSADWNIEGARKLMGHIDLDPASSVEFNKRVKADRIFTEADNGLVQAWTKTPRAFEHINASRTFLNPPGRLTKEFWAKLIEEWQAGRVAEAVWIGFNLDHLRYLAESELWPLSFPTLIPRKRIHFSFEDGTVSKRPSAANYITYLPPVGGRAFARAKFKEVFSQYGRVI